MRKKESELFLIKRMKIFKFDLHCKKLCFQAQFFNAIPGSKNISDDLREVSVAAYQF